MERRRFLQTVGLAMATGGLLPAGQAVGADSEQAKSGAAPRIIAGPYLQNLTQDRVTIVWVTDHDGVSWVDYGVGDQLDRRAHHAEHGLIDAMTRVHRVTLDGLAPAKDYSYRVCSKEILKFMPYEVDFGGVVQSETMRFRTVDPGEQGVSFVCFNDVHNRPYLWDVLFPVAKAEPFDLAILNGDVLDAPHNHERVVEYLASPFGAFLGGTLPFVLVRGNHEARGVHARHLLGYVATPNDRWYYSFTRGPVCFLVLDGGEDKDDTNEEYFGLVDFDRYIAEEIAWLEQEIKRPEFQAAPFRVAFMHIPRPLFTDLAPLDPRGRFGPLLQEGRVDLLISGHTHSAHWVDPEPGRRDYAVAIGGGCEITNATLIRAQAQNEVLRVTILAADGTTITGKELKRRGA